MAGRYGSDELYWFSFAVLVLLSVVNLFAHQFWLWLAESLVLVLLLFRFFSRNIGRRQTENRSFLRLVRKVERFFKQTYHKISRFFKLQRQKWRDRKTHVFRKCPHCRAVLRLPKIKGPHHLSCPRCRFSFDIKV